MIRYWMGGLSVWLTCCGLAFAQPPQDRERPDGDRRGPRMEHDGPRSEGHSRPDMQEQREGSDRDRRGPRMEHDGPRSERHSRLDMQEQREGSDRDREHESVRKHGRGDHSMRSQGRRGPRDVGGRQAGGRQEGGRPNREHFVRRAMEFDRDDDGALDRRELSAFADEIAHHIHQLSGDRNHRSSSHGRHSMARRGDDGEREMPGHRPSRRFASQHRHPDSRVADDRMNRYKDGNDEEVDEHKGDDQDYEKDDDDEDDDDEDDDDEDQAVEIEDREIDRPRE